MSNSLSPLPLTELAHGINREHAEVESSFKASLLHAKNAGDLLLEAKTQVEHGKWLPWLESNCTVSERTAQSYMRIATRWNELSNPQRVADLSYRDALRLLSHSPDQPDEAGTSVTEPELDPHTVAESRPAAERSLLEMLLPTPLSFLLVREAVTEAHVKTLLALREVYTTRLVRPFPPKEVMRMGRQLDAQALLYFIRPEEHPLILSDRHPFSPSEPRMELVMQACNAFLADVRRRNGPVLQWEVASFWWGCLAVLLQLSPEELATAIDSWRDRFEDALLWWNMFRGDKVPDDKAMAREWWGFRSDLKQSGALGLATDLCANDNEVNSGLYERLARKCGDADSYTLPTRLQWQMAQRIGDGQLA